MKLQSDKYTTGQKALSHEEYKKLLSVITDVEDECLIKLAVATGLRREDLCNILLKNIDEKNCRLTFREAKKDTILREPTYVDENGKKRRGKPKRDEHGNILKEEKWRIIDISPQTLAVIQKFVKTLNKKEKNNRIYLFSIKGRQAYNRLQTLCKKAGIDERPFHALRATCVKFAHNAGWTDEQICALTGDTLTVIQQHYRTPSVGEMSEVTKTREFI